MNRDDRRTFRELVKGLEVVQVALEEMRDDLQDRLDNLQEHFSESPSIDALEFETEHIDDAVNDLAVAISTLEEVA